MAAEIDILVIEAAKKSVLDEQATMTKAEYDAQNEALMKRLHEGDDVERDIYDLNAKLFHKMIAKVPWPKQLVERKDFDGIAYECAMTAIMSLADEEAEEKFTIQYLATACYKQALVMLEQNYSPGGIRISHYAYLKGARTSAKSLDYETDNGEDSSTKYIDYVAVKNQDVRLPGNRFIVYNLEEEFFEEEDLKTILQTISKMSKRKQYIIKEYCGFSTGTKRPFEDIARDLHTSRDSVRRIYNNAIDEIRGALHIYVKNECYHPCA